MTVGPFGGELEEELKEAAGATDSESNASLHDDAFLRSSPSVVPFARDYANGYQPPVQAPSPIRKVRRRDFKNSNDRAAFEPRPSINESLEPSGRREYPLGESAYPLQTQDQRSASDRVKAAGPRRFRGFRGLQQKLAPLQGRTMSSLNDEEKNLVRQVREGKKMKDAISTLQDSDSRSLTPSSRFIEADPRNYRSYGKRLREDASIVEAPIPEAYSEDENAWSVPGGQNSRDWQNGYQPPLHAAPPIREVDRTTFPDKDSRPESLPRPSENPHGDLESSGRRDYPMGENSVPIAKQSLPTTSEKLRSARLRRKVGAKERREALSPEARALEATDAHLAKVDRKEMRKATRPFRQVTSADTGQATMSGAGYVGLRKLGLFGALGAQRQELQDTIAAKQAKIDSTGFRWGNIGNWFSGLFRNRGRRRDIARAREQMSGLDVQAARSGISDFSDETGAALRSQADLEARIPKTGGDSRTFAEARDKTQKTYLAQGPNGILGERPMLQHVGLAAADSLARREQPDGTFAPGSTVSSSIDALMNEPERRNAINPDSVKKWGAPAASAGTAIPEASIDDEDADDMAEGARPSNRRRTPPPLFTKPNVSTLVPNAMRGIPDDLSQGAIQVGSGGLDPEEEKVDVDTIDSGPQPGLDDIPDSGAGDEMTSKPDGGDYEPMTPGQHFAAHVWDGYDPARHLLPGEKAARRHDLGPGAREARFPVHEDPNFDPTDAYVRQLTEETTPTGTPTASRPPHEMIQPQQPRVPEQPAPSESSPLSGSEDTLRILMERLQRGGRR